MHPLESICARHKHELPFTFIYTMRSGNTFATIPNHASLRTLYDDHFVVQYQVIAQYSHLIFLTGTVTLHAFERVNVRRNE